MRSDDVPTKSSPPPVATGPPRGAWLPVPVTGASLLTSPSGICHRIVPLLRSYAVICDHGGPIADKPVLGWIMKSTGATYGTKPSPAFGGGRGGGRLPPPAPPPPAPPPGPVTDSGARSLS